MSNWFYDNFPVTRKAFNRLKAAIAGDTGYTVNQSNCVAGGMKVRGDMCGGNMVIRGNPRIAPGSFIGGDLRINDTKSTVAEISAMDFAVQGKVIVNNVDVTDEFRRIRQQG